MCPKRNKLFCFICLVMGGNQSAWTQEGDAKDSQLRFATPFIATVPRVAAEWDPAPSVVFLWEERRCSSPQFQLKFSIPLAPTCSRQKFIGLEEWNAANACTPHDLLIFIAAAGSGLINGDVGSAAITIVRGRYADCAGVAQVQVATEKDIG
ncbi:hypothetical protein NQ318_004468 [Aromia moschata]|uniref:Uncharacterized protein n=1 Tax=Aromia moschata TaxID=1265417 RepID=A0AAV8YDZ7_9CUCU|nr:hypothetical protein NQ318_004468 [Aromia moschata]